MEKLSNVSVAVEERTREICELDIAELGVKTVMVQEWIDGKSTRCGNLKSLVLVLGHFDGQEDNPEADVHIQATIPQF